MLFHSNDFLFFLGGVLLAYYLVRRWLAARNVLILLASYVFYGWWDYRFVVLLLFSSVLDFGVGLGLGRTESPRLRRALLILSVAGNLGLLGSFKYLDFFGESLAGLLSVVGVAVAWEPFGWLLPVGISFYTFQSLSYTIDVYRRQIVPTTNPVQFLGYVAFFPQLVAGPIERAAHLLPQFQRTLRIDAAAVERGVWLILWGLFKKVALADNLAPLVEMVYGMSAPAGPIVVLGTVAFALQIYCDFSAYSDIARGVASLLGFDLMLNFDRPYLATSLRDFWRRWHISLSTWLRDYLYAPLGGNRRGRQRTYFNLGLTMLLAGIWHGAAAQFILWGIWHGLGLMVNRWWTERRAHGRPWPGWLAWSVTMAFILYGWLLFRAESLEQVRELTGALAVWSWPPWGGSFGWNLLVLFLPLALMEAWQHYRRSDLVPLSLPWWGKAALQGALCIGIAAFWEREAAPFIYFQF